MAAPNVHTAFIPDNKHSFNMETKRWKSNGKNYKMFLNGKLNTNFPRNYNLLLGRVEFYPTEDEPLKLNYKIIK